MSSQTLERPTLPVPVRKPTSFTITPTGGPLGAIVTGLDVRHADHPDTVATLKQAHDTYHVLIFKNQTLEPKELIAFATLFGPIFRSESHIPVAGWKNGITPDIVNFNSDPEAEADKGPIGFHIDHKWTPYPSSSSLLYAEAVPSRGGETYWTNLVRAYDELDSATKEHVEGLRLFTYNGFVRTPGKFKPGYRLNTEDPAEGPIFSHPLVRTHPTSGRKILFLDVSSEVELEDTDPAQGRELIARLREHIQQPHLTYEHIWSVGDIVWWDNKATQHARNDWDASERRTLRRVSIGGERPF